MKRKILFWVVTGLLVFFMGVLVYSYLPLGPAMKLDVSTPILDDAALTDPDAADPALEDSSQKDDIPAVGDIQSTGQEKAGSQANLTPCGSGSFIFIILGDSQIETKGQRGFSSIRLVKVDFENQVVTIAALSPDLWVRTRLSGLEGAASLTRIHWQGYQLAHGEERRRISAAASAVAQALVDNFVVVSDHYLHIRLEIFSDLIDALGGVEVNLPQAMDGGILGLYPTGLQVLDGKQAGNFVRMWKVAGDSTPSEAERIARQDILLLGLLKQAKSPSVLLKAPALVETFYDNLFTDLSPKELLSMICLLNQPGLVIHNVNAIDGFTTPGEGRILLPLDQKLQQLLAYQFRK